MLEKLLYRFYTDFAILIRILIILKYSFKVMSPRIKGLTSLDLMLGYFKNIYRDHCSVNLHLSFNGKGCERVLVKFILTLRKTGLKCFIAASCSHFRSKWPETNHGTAT